MKKSILVFVIIICVAAISKAQQYKIYTPNYSDKYNSRIPYTSFYSFESDKDPIPLNFYIREQYRSYSWNQSDSIISAKKIMSYKYENITYDDGIKTGVSTQVKVYSPKGRVLLYRSSNIKIKKGKEIPISSRFTNMTKTNNLKEQSHFGKWNHLNYKTIYEYDSTDLLFQTKSYYGKKIKYSGRTVYEWYSKGKAKQITYYKRKEYNPSVVSFDCLPEGRTENTRKDTATVCRKTEVDADGNEISIEITRDEKGNEYKTVKRYNKLKKFYSVENYNTKGEYAFGEEKIYNECSKFPIIEVTYGKNKTFKDSTVATYNDKKQIVSKKRFDKNRKIFWEIEYAYDANGKNIKINEYGKNHKPLESESYIYSNNLRTEIIVIKNEGSRKNDYCRTTREYDSEKRLIKETSFYKDNTVRSAIANHINENGLYDKIERFGEGNKLVSLTTYTFEYYK